MKFIQTLTWLDDLNQKLDSFKEWLASSDHNFFWVIAFFVGVALFSVVYKSLSRD